MAQLPKNDLVRGPDQPIYTRKRRRKPGRLKEKRNKKFAKKNMKKWKKSAGNHRNPETWHQNQESSHSRNSRRRREKWSSATRGMSRPWEWLTEAEVEAQ